MRIAIFLIGIIFLTGGCKNTSKKIDIISVMSNVHSNQNLTTASLSNIDSLGGLKGIKLEARFEDFDWSKSQRSQEEKFKDTHEEWAIDSSQDGKFINCRIILYNGNITINSDTVSGMFLYFVNKQLEGLKLLVKNTRGFDTGLTSVFGSPTYADTTFNAHMINFFRKRKAASSIPNYSTFEYDKLPDVFFNSGNILWDEYKSRIDDIETGGITNIINSAARHESSFVRLANAEEKASIIQRIIKRYVMETGEFSSAKDSTQWKTSKYVLTYCSKFSYMVHPIDERFSNQISYRVYANEKYPNNGFPLDVSYSYEICNKPLTYLEMFTTTTESSTNWENQFNAALFKQDKQDNTNSQLDKPAKDF